MTFEHELVVIRTGRRSGLPVIVAVHSTALGQAVGGCRIWRYAGWRAGLADALRLSAGMTLKCAIAGVDAGGGKTVVAVPEGTELDARRRRAALLDVGEVVESLDGAYATGPDVGTAPDDMVVIGETTTHVFCRPERLGGSGDSSPHTATGTLAALRAVSERIRGTTGLAGLRLAVTGLGNVGGRLARLLAAEGAELLVTDIDPARRELAGELGATWIEPAAARDAEVDVLVPAALGGLLTKESVGSLRCAAIVGPANNQLATPEVADLLQQRGIVWIPDYLAGAGGVIYGIATELRGETPDAALIRVQAIEDVVRSILKIAEHTGETPAGAARDRVHRRIAGHPAP